MKKHEAKFATLFRHWIKRNPWFCSAFELKHTRGNNYFPFDEVQDHQLAALKASTTKEGFLYKISDDSLGAKPFDMFFLANARAYVVIRFPEFFCFIDVFVFEKEKKTNKRKSVGEHRAIEIAEKVIHIPVASRK